MKNRAGLKLSIAMMLLSAACGFLLPPAPTPAPVPTEAVAERQLKVFDALFAAVRDQYVMADYGGVDWVGLGAQYRAVVAAGQSDEAFAQTLRSLLGKLPPGAASYQTRAERLEQETSDQVTYSGIGAFIAFRREPQPHITILSTIENSPAESAGLQPHDSIYAVDGAPLTLEDENSPSARIRGEAGSTVTITVTTPGKQPRPVSLQRAQIQAVDPLRGGNLSAVNVAYYRIPVAADTNLAATIAGDLDTISKTVRLKGIILDLRVAASGAGSWPLTDMLTLFANGKVGEFYTHTASTPVTVIGVDAGGSQSLPLTILVGPDTSGTPEVFAAALQGLGRADVIGLGTPGKVQGFDTIALPDGSRLFLATSAFRTTQGLDPGARPA